MAAVTPGLNPSILVSPNYQTQMEAVQRQRALATALRSQSLQDIPGNGGSISWTQGLAKLADALAGNIVNKRADKQQINANQGYAAAMARMFGLPAPQTAQGAPTAPSATATPQPPQNAPGAAPAQPQAPFVPGAPVAAGQPDPLAPLPPAPPQAAPQPPSASTPAPTGGASPMSLTGDPRRDMMLYMMNPDAYTQQLAAVAGKGATPSDIEIAVNHAREAMARGDVATASTILQSIQKQNYIAPVSGRPGGWTLFSDGHREYNPTAPAPGAMPVMDANGQPTGRWTEDPSVSNIQASQAGAVAGAQAGAKAPFDTIETYNPNTGQMEIRPKSDVTGGGALNSYYGRGPQSGTPAGASGRALPAGPSLGAQAAANTYGSGSANAFLDTQAISKESPQRVQALREMQGLLKGGLSTGPTTAKFQQLAEEHGLPFGYSNNAFVFNKDAARFVAQSASDLGLNGSDARLGMMANASPNMKMTPEALKVVIPTMIGLEYAKMAKATAAAAYAQHNPAGNAQFESQWRQAYDPRMFTAYAEGGAAALAKAPAAERAQWLKDYRMLKSMGVDFGQFAQ